MSNPFCVFRVAIRSLAILLLAAAGARGQPSPPRIGYVYPAGGQQGTTFEITVGGQYLEGVTNVYFSGSGAHAAIVARTKPLTPKQANLLREELQALQEKRAAAQQYGRPRRDLESGPPGTNRVVWTDADAKRIAEIRKLLATFIPVSQLNPALAETVMLEVTLAANAEPGVRDIRLGAPAGLSNPRAFQVDQLPEYSRKAARAVREPREGRDGETPVSIEPELKVSLPAVVNGQIMPGGVNRFGFTARKGARVVIVAYARELLPYLPDAVPGWFQAALALYDAQTNELAFADHYLFHPDPVIYYEIPKDGEYWVQIRDSIYRGREDFVYRIRVGELPFMTGLFPLGAQIGTQQVVAIRGVNLPGTSLALNTQDKSRGIYPVTVRTGAWLSNRMPFALDTLPEGPEIEPNDSPTNAQPITLPMVINGCIQRPGDWDVFRIDGRAGDELVAEVLARRLDSPLDSVLKLTDSAGRQLAFNDDQEDRATGLNTHHADSYLRFTLPTNGSCALQLGDAQRKGGPDYAYRLRVSAPRPDFELRITPASINIHGGKTAPLTVHALRKDGFSGEIELTVSGPAEGMILSGGRVPARQDQVQFTLTAPVLLVNTPVKIELDGRATINGREVVRKAVPAEDMMQAFAYRHLVPVRELDVAVSSRSAARAFMRVLSPTPVKFQAGQTAEVWIGTPRDPRFVDLQFELNEPPDGISLQRITPAGRQTKIVLQYDAAKVKPGLKGNLIINVFMPRKNMAGAPARPQRKPQRLALGSLPAIPFEIVEPRANPSEDGVR